MTGKDSFEIAFMLRQAWSREDSHLKVIKNQKDDGSPNWDTYHAMQIETLSSKVEAAWGLYDRFMKEYKALIRTGMGL